MRFFLKDIKNDLKLVFTFYLTLFGSLFIGLFFIIAAVNGNNSAPLLLIATCLGYANLYLLKTKYKHMASVNLAAIVCLITFSLIILGGHKGTGYFWTFPNITIAIAVLTVRQGLWYSVFSLMGCAFIMFLSPEFEWIRTYDADVAIRFLMASTALHVMSLVLMNIQEKTNAKLHNKMVTDDLTGLYNRSVLTNASRENEQRRSLTNENYALLFDVDHFKRINDDFGHSIGDDVLKQLGKLMQAHSRTSDLAIRWGGEEFLIILKNCNKKDAMNKAEKLRKGVEDCEVLQSLVERPVTISIGVAQHMPETDLHDALVLADEHLYSAKESGRNKVCG
jgi:diguanylate cyclase (GGDEF)-like protein